MPRMLRISTLPPNSASFLRRRDTCASSVLDSVASHQKGFEDQGFAAPKEDFVVGHSDLVRADVKFDVPERQDRGDVQSRPPQDCPYPGDEFLRLEGLAKIIVRPAVLPIDHVFFG